MFRVVTMIWLFSHSAALLAQESDELSYAEQLLALEMEMDSLSIFNLLDSVLLTAPTVRSEMNVRLGATSSVTSSGRDYDIEQTGYSFGISYFHKSGPYLDLSGYYNSGVTPSYNPTILAGGYLGSIGSKWSYSVDFERWFYNPKDSSENTLPNNIGASINYDFGKLYAGLDYSLLFGSETGHRFIGSLTGTFRLGKLGVFKDVTLFPSVTMIAGTGDVTTLRITTEQLSNEEILRIDRIDSLSQLSDFQLQQLFRAVANADRLSAERRQELLALIATAATISDEDLALLNDLAVNGIEQEEYVDGNEFGILNYSFSLPLSLSTNRLSVLLSYTYSIPVKLPSEIFDVDPVGYFGLSVSYRIPY